MKRLLLLALIILMSTGNANAADIESDVSAGSGGLDNSNGGYLEAGIGLNLNRDGDASLALILAGAYRFRGFFLEASSPGIQLPIGPVSGVTLGYNLWRTDRWAVDFLGASTKTRPTNFNEVDQLDSAELERERAVIDRSTFYNGAGVRLTGHFGNTIFQYRLEDDTHGGNGVTSSARVAYSQQIKNWNFHGVGSVDYTSGETTNFWYGVSEQEASLRFPRDDIRTSTITYSAEIGVTYPLRENLVFRSTARYIQRDDDLVNNTSFIENNFDSVWTTTLSYVF